MNEIWERLQNSSQFRSFQSPPSSASSSSGATSSDSDGKSSSRSRASGLKRVRNNTSGKGKWTALKDLSSSQATLYKQYKKAWSDMQGKDGVPQFNFDNDHGRTSAVNRVRNILHELFASTRTHVDVRRSRPSLCLAVVYFSPLNSNSKRELQVC